ncbi:MAG: 7-cyano-7-deazaguanine synthase, partial [Rubrobacteraceae bacterium]|nr:7-cyano-7-deazaguanine synthase [Rubrobacteraceae bacterium]
MLASPADVHHRRRSGALRVKRQAKSAGLILGRNAFLVTAALMEKPASVSVIATGIHSGTGYADCSPEFATKIQAVLNIYEEAHVQLAAPFLDWTKADIIKYCSMKEVPVALTYSCESGPE